MLPHELTWIRSGGHRLDARLRRQLFELYRPPRWLPCWFHGLWFAVMARVFRLPVIIGTEGDCAQVHGALKEHGCKVSHGLKDLPFICTRAHARALQALCECDGVTRIWPDMEVRALLDTAVPAAGAVRAVSRYSGRGVTVAVLDTGIYPHPDLRDRITAFHDVIAGRTAPYDDNGHGTHVAGCAAGDGGSSEGRYRGPAPGASLVGVKVLNKVGSGSMSGLLAGIDWVIQNRDRHGIDIMNMSLGASAQAGCANDPLCQAVGRAWQAGIVAVVAAGNEGPGFRTVATPGINPQVITVGAMDDRNTPDRADDLLAGFSSRGPTPDGQTKPDILAPGVQITAARSPGSYIDKQSPGARVGQWYLTLSGTSMATPVVAGLCALLLEAEPALSPDEVKGRLKATAQDRGLQPDEQGAGYVDADRALGL